MTEQPQSPWVERLAAAPYSERGRMLDDLVVERFRSTLLFGRDEEVPRDTSYFELGLTSLGAVEIEQYLRVTTGRPINTATVLNNPTINHLVAYLRTELLREFFPVARSGEDGRRETAAAQNATRRALLDDLLGELYQA
ncbi:MAG TPA: acyl carrier protein [Actinocrinis sp.]|uniref:acyl carrier protein n=1 Tax=Actinocrinis sp. TaxID=1920516 RepID=UPI002DDDA88C|nr:acyl carrier protein [Actinocrinis sp.]HEV2344624.1 acyl carrier protein [Actinocrinis sp.]